MRRFVDILALLTVLAVAGWWWMSHTTVAEPTGIDETRVAVDTMRAQVVLRSYSGRETINAVGWPESIDPAWFDELPRNALLDGNRPWLEIASEAQSGWRHPRPVFATDREHAAFWYNPRLGIVRARVTLEPTDAITVDRYNRVNGTSLNSTDPTTFGDDDAVVLTTADVKPDD